MWPRKFVIWSTTYQWAMRTHLIAMKNLLFLYLVLANLDEQCLIRFCMKWILLVRNGISTWIQIGCIIDSMIMTFQMMLSHSIKHRWTHTCLWMNCARNRCRQICTFNTNTFDFIQTLIPNSTGKRRSRKVLQSLLVSSTVKNMLDSRRNDLGRKAIVRIGIKKNTKCSSSPFVWRNIIVL